MGNVPDPHRVTIKVSGGFVQDVYTTLSFHIEVDILDLDCAGRESPEAVADMNAYLDKVKREQQKIY